jgi:predicted nucleic acid-binding protein
LSTSVAAKWVVEKDHSGKAALLADFDALHALDHWLAEAVNVQWSKVFCSDLTAADAEERMTTLMRAPIVSTRIAGFMPRAFAISVALLLRSRWQGRPHR